MLTVPRRSAWTGRLHADHDHHANDTLRFVQMTPPGSAYCIVPGTGLTTRCVMRLADVETRGETSSSTACRPATFDVQPYGSFVTFSDPDGNTWALQQLPPRS